MTAGPSVRHSESLISCGTRWIWARVARPAAILCCLALIISSLTTPLAPDVAAQQSVPYFVDPIQAAGVDGPVWASELVGNELWIGGEFSTARNFGAGSPDVATSGVAVLDINTGDLLPYTFAINGGVYGIEFHEDTIWIVGEFTTVDGQTAQNIVALDAVTKQRKTTFVAAANDEFRDVEYHDGWLYLGGNPSFYNGTPIGRVIRVDPATGALDTSWLPAVDRYVEGLDAFGDLLAVAERSNQNGAETKLLSLVTGLKVDGLDAASRVTSGMWDAEFSEDGAYVYLAETGNSISKYTVSDQLEWVTPRAGGDMQAVAVAGDYVFAGFHESWNGNEERKMIALNATTGAEETSWYVEMNSYWGVWDIEVYPQGLVAAGEFTDVNGVNARRIAIFRPTGPWDPADPIDLQVAGDVNCDDAADITDALFLVQYSVDNRTMVQDCVGFDPLTEIRAEPGDVDDDGVPGVIDAMLIAQCVVGNPNTLCPEDP